MALRTPLTKHVIAQRALAIADAEGLESVTVRRVTRELGVTAMALYSHFADKEALLDAVVDEVLSGVSIPDTDLSHPEVALSATLHAVVAGFRAHRACLSLIPSRIFRCNAGLVMTEALLDALTAFPGEHDDGAACRYILGAVIALVDGELGGPLGGSGYRTLDADSTQTILRALPTERFPRVAVAARGLTHTADPVRYYREGINRIVYGIAAC